MAQNFSMPVGYLTENGLDYLVRVGDKIQDVEEIAAGAPAPVYTPAAVSVAAPAPVAREHVVERVDPIA